jgi:hypothetical protein
MNPDFMNKAAQAFRLDPYTKYVLDTASSHPFDCRCLICIDWWVRMGPDGDSYGPFSMDEVRARSLETGQPFIGPDKPDDDRDIPW